jgi:CxxC motif-containing protein (DUF1111 family)
VVVAACADRIDPVPVGDPLPGLTEAQHGRFLLGRAVFERRATEEEGLGPLFNGERCSTCHQTPAIGGSSGVLVLKATRYEDGRCDILAAHGGDNLQQRATSLLRAAGLGPERIPDEANGQARFVAPPLYGLGLVEAIPEGDITRRADPDDEDGDGVSGRANRTSDGRLGRFGHKADSPTLAHFIDTALRFELGFTTPEHPREETVNGLPLPDGVDPMPEPEIDVEGVSRLVDFVRYLAPPVPAPPGDDATRDSLRAGGEAFTEVGCAACHTPELVTGPSEIEALSRKRVALYSDLLLHDLGPELAGTCSEGAGPSEYRTAPLWGVGERTLLLHDGRAGSIKAAIEAHAGEAAAAVSAYEALPPARRAQLLRFVATR